MNTVKIDHLEKLTNLLEREKSRFSHYQILPECVQKKLSQQVINYNSEQVQIDKQRYAFLVECLGDTCIGNGIGNAIEIGANIGYFSINLARQFKCNIDAYEPINLYVDAIKIMSQICGVERQINAFSRSIGIEDLPALNQYQLGISLNVLHHAGNLYDKHKINEIAGWRSYFIDYLELLLDKSEFLFLQTGNTWDDQAIFDSETAAMFIAQAIRETGWIIDKVGVIENYDSMRYQAYTEADLVEIKKVKCRRNNTSNRVEYSVCGNIIAELKTGMAQRPLWFLRKNKKS